MSQDVNVEQQDIDLLEPNLAVSDVEDISEVSEDSSSEDETKDWMTLMTEIFGELRVNLKKGIMFGDQALTENKPRAATVITTQYSMFIIIKKEHFDVIEKLNKQEKQYKKEFLMQVMPSLSVINADKYVNDMINTLVTETWKKRSLITKQGNEGNKLYFVKSGTVKIFYKIPSTGKVVNISEVESGCLLGEECLDLINDGFYKYSCQVSSIECTFLTLPKRYFQTKLPHETLTDLFSTFQEKDHHRMHTVAGLCNETELAEILDATKPKLFIKKNLMSVKIRKNNIAEKCDTENQEIGEKIELKKYFEANFKRKPNLNDQKWYQSMLNFQAKKNKKDINVVDKSHNSGTQDPLDNLNNRNLPFDEIHRWRVDQENNSQCTYLKMKEDYVANETKDMVKVITSGPQKDDSKSTEFDDEIITVVGNKDVITSMKSDHLWDMNANTKDVFGIERPQKFKLKSDKSTIQGYDSSSQLKEESTKNHLKVIEPDICNAFLRRVRNNTNNIVDYGVEEHEFNKMSFNIRSNEAVDLFNTSHQRMETKASCKTQMNFNDQKDALSLPAPKNQNIHTDNLGLETENKFNTENDKDYNFDNRRKHQGGSTRFPKTFQSNYLNLNKTKTGNFSGNVTGNLKSMRTRLLSPFSQHSFLSEEKEFPGICTIHKLKEYTKPIFKSNYCKKIDNKFYHPKLAMQHVSLKHLKNNDTTDVSKYFMIGPKPNSELKEMVHDNIKDILNENKNLGLNKSSSLLTKNYDKIYSRINNSRSNIKNSYTSNSFYNKTSEYHQTLKVPSKKKLNDSKFTSNKNDYHNYSLSYPKSEKQFYNDISTYRIASNQTGDPSLCFEVKGQHSKKNMVRDSFELNQKLANEEKLAALNNPNKLRKISLV